MVGSLKRMTTWKVWSGLFLGRRTETQPFQSKLAISRNDKDETMVDESMLNLGLFSYPVLQAADVLLYRYE
jgi:tryptophanyl-tRNA synthetase